MSKHLKICGYTSGDKTCYGCGAKRKSQGRACDDAESLFVIGIIGFVLLATATFLCGRIPHMIGIAAGFAILALPDLALIIAYFNQRIYYTDEMFVHKNHGASSDCTDMRISPVYA